MVAESIETDIPARLDRLEWGKWHWLVVIALGITWILDGLEVTVVGSVGSVLEEHETLNLSASDVGLAGTAYIAGAIVGALLFGHLADLHGRKRLFFATLLFYAAASAATALSVNFATFAACRFFTGMGIGGEYAAINSAIDAQRVTDPAPLRTIRIAVGRRFGLADVARIVLTQYRKRAVFCLSLMIAQAFFYNAIFFTYALTLTRFYGVLPEHVGSFVLPFALGNLLGPLVLGHFFDTIGRKKMIAFTYGTSGLLLLLTGYWFEQGLLTSVTHALMWSASFFFASAAASSAYLTVSELFPLEIRALAIALFYALGTGTGGLLAPALFGKLIESGSRGPLFAGYGLAALLMVGAAAITLVLGVAAEGRALEDVAAPLSALEHDS